MTRFHPVFFVIGFVCLLFIAGCAEKRPVLYPNYHLKQVGMSRAEADINECMRLASEYGVRNETGQRVLKKTAANAAVGAAAGGVGAAVLGRNVGKGAAVGASVTGAATLTRELLKSDTPDPLFRRYVEKCLREKGYSVIGWR